MIRHVLSQGRIYNRCNPGRMNLSTL
ncbi:unnamed protein product [Calypogeia fissa]